MSFGDLFYPGNPDRRRKVTQLAQKIFGLMESNFEATNELIELMNNHGKTSISKIYVNQRETLKHNADVLTTKVKEVQHEVEKVDKKLKEKLEPSAYAAIHDIDLSVEDTFRLVKNIATIATGAISTIAATVAVVAIAKGFVLVSLVVKIGALATCAIACVVIGALFIGIDIFISIFTGAEEREQLEDAIEDLERTLRVFEPASKAYTKDITRVIFKIECLLEEEGKKRP